MKTNLKNTLKEMESKYGWRYVEDACFNWINRIIDNLYYNGKCFIPAYADMVEDATYEREEEDRD